MKDEKGLEKGLGAAVVVEGWVAIDTRELEVGAPKNGELV